MNYVNLSYYQFRYVRYMSDICRYVRYLSDICRYLSDIGHIGNLGSFTKAILLQKCSISLISPDIAIRSRSSRSDWLHHRRDIGDRTSDGRTNMKNLRPPTQKAPSGQKCLVSFAASTASQVIRYRLRAIKLVMWYYEMQ